MAARLEILMTSPCSDQARHGRAAEAENVRIPQGQQAVCKTSIGSFYAPIAPCPSRLGITPIAATPPKMALYLVFKATFNHRDLSPPSPLDCRPCI
ncbi:Uncharacterised protein [Bordetella pertussis]|nr:Uncharacterised protein [Bordetella pertussis]